MKRIITTLIICANISLINAQVGIGTNTPDNSAMLDVEGTEKGILFPRMTTVQRLAIASPAIGLHVFDITTNTMWFFDGLNWINYAAQAKYGDVKSGIQTLDHEGWILLDGRAINTLSPTQQAVAVSLGLTTNLPDATDAYLVQNGGGMGTVSGNNTKLIVQNNLPNVTLGGSTNSTGNHAHTGSTDTAGDHSHSGSTSTNGNHNHSYNDRGYGGTGFVAAEETNLTECAEYDSANRTTGSAGNHNHSITTNTTGNHTHTLSINSAGTHSHSVTTTSINGGVAQQSFDVTPRSLSVNMFVYLGL